MTGLLADATARADRAEQRVDEATDAGERADAEITTLRDAVDGMPRSARTEDRTVRAEERAARAERPASNHTRGQSRSPAAPLVDATEGGMAGA